ncbi:Transmembrane protein, partial [Toxocara canis]
AVFGFHIVVTLITFTVFTKFRSRFSLALPFLCSGLYRYLAPTAQELKEKVPLYIMGKNRKRKPDKNVETNGFLVPKNADIELILVPVYQDDVQALPMYSTFSWIVDFVTFSLVVYSCSEVFRFFFPVNADINVSIIWILLSVFFVFQALANVTVSLFSGDKVEAERNLVISFALLFFLFSMMFTMFAEGFFDIGFNKAYESFSTSASAFFAASDVPFPAGVAERSPLLLFISLSVMFALLAGTLLFPNFRYARMYTNTVDEATRFYKFIYHLAFLSQAFSLMLFTHPVKNYLLYGPRKVLSEPGLESLRIMSVLLTMGARVAFRRAHLQSHLNMAADALARMRKQAGNINSMELQRMIFRYFSYINVAALQYFIPALLPALFALLLKTLGNYSWIGKEYPRTSPPVDAQRLASLQVLFNETVQRGIWSLFLVVTLLMNFSLSLIGVVYNSYFQKV